VVAVDTAERDAVVRELKAAQRGYLEPIFNGQRPKKLIAPVTPAKRVTSRSSAGRM
jgi:hypothetical protein